MTTTRTRALGAGSLLVLGLLTGACSAGGSGGSNDSAAASTEAAVSGGGADRLADVPGAADAPAPANRTVVKVKAVIKTGEVAVTDPDLDRARRELDDLLVSLGGTVDSEQTEHDRDGDITNAQVVVRVPVQRFDAAMRAIEGLGKTQHSDTSGKDVTTEVIDVEERVQTLENSLDRLQSYQRRAKDVDELLRFERDITARQSELQSLQAQQAYLADQTSMSTISVYLSTPEKYVAPPGALDDAGFLAGLEGGWNALVDTVVVALTVVGAVLPFGVVLLVVGLPAWLLVRRLRQRRREAAVAE
ncbi:DUF4349 domain-containing protein [Nocardioides mesophilus]|uniref:DUF4349 domain-containing protein n=1 Tax=Nocardioides mesophilus TaxID=433659 RepID=A0A7G9RA15_9ACTN|nr:DUF4349 domain-containing protein [Nocardioides mesophilus]QNN52440.1 DUF4349 domain-containing protein [Nocardioides mesophilus]